jgi:hypothetical protein
MQRSSNSWSPIQKQRRRSLQEVAQRKLLNKFKLQPNEEIFIKRRLSTPIPTLQVCLNITFLNFGQGMPFGIQFQQIERRSSFRRRKWQEAKEKRWND